MGSRPDPWAIPPTEAQLEAMCRKAAEIAQSWGWQADDITIERVMTHAEAASNRDGRWIHDNYGTVIWSGIGERWDCLQLTRNGPPIGCDELSTRIRRFMAEPAAAPPSAVKAEPEGLVFRRPATINARDQELAVELRANGSSWALAADLLSLYEIPYPWEAGRRRVLIGSFDVMPSFREDQVQPGAGWSLFEMTLQNGTAPVILRENRAW